MGVKRDKINTPTIRGEHLKVPRRAVLRNNAIVYFTEEGFELECNAKKAKEVYKEQIGSITHFVETMREKMDALRRSCTN